MESLENPVLNCSRSFRLDNQQDTISSLFTKIDKYREKILSNKIVERQLDLYVEPRTKTYCKIKNEEENEPVELILDVKKSFLDVPSSKVLLLTGQPGAGKSLFCKYLQKLIFERYDEEESKKLVPIYTELRRLTRPRASAITETLMQELLLTENEILALKTLSGEDRREVLFIFDGYDDIIDRKQFPLDKGDERQKSFYMSNGFRGGWDDSKIIISSRDNIFSKISQRESLFAPVEEETGEIVAESFLERAILPFEQDQVRAYFKKYIVLKGILDNGNHATVDPFSWPLISEYELIVSSLHWEKIFSRPSLLMIGSELLSDLLEGNLSLNSSNYKLVNENKEEIPPKLPKKYLYGFYVRKSIKRAIQALREDSDCFGREKSLENRLTECLQRAEEHALLLSQLSSLETLEKGKEFERIDELLVSAGILQRNEFPNSGYSFSFTDKSIQEYFVGSRIEKSITSNSSESLLNRKVFCNGSQIIQLLAESLKEQKFSAQGLLKLANISKKGQESTFKQPEENKTNDSNSLQVKKCWDDMQPEDIAKANVIRVLNAVKFKFRNLDLRKANIPGLDLTFVDFHDVDLTGANLQGGVFEKAKLKNVGLSGANLSNIILEEYPPIETPDGVTNVSYTPDGKNLLICTREGVIIYERDEKLRCFKENKRLPEQKNFTRSWVLNQIANNIMADESISDSPQYFPEYTESSFAVGTHDISPDGNTLVSAREKVLIVKKLTTSSKQKTRAAREDVNDKLVKVSSNGKWAVSHASRENQIHIWDFKRKKYVATIKLPAQIFCYTSCNGLYMSDKIVISTTSRPWSAWDLIRRNLIKQLAYSDTQHLPVLFHPNGRSSIGITYSGRQPIFQDLADGKYDKTQFLNCDVSHMALRPDGRQIALNTPNKIFFKTLGSENWNNKTLRLGNTTIDASIGISESNLTVFKERGDYGKFNSNFVQEILLNPDPTLVTEIKLEYQNIEQKGAELISKNFMWTNLEKLYLQGNNIRNKGGIAITGNIRWEKLKVLNLSGNGIYDKCAKELGRNTVWRDLEELCLEYNNISAEGSMVISSNSAWPKLRILNLGANRIGNEGAAGIARNSTWVELEELDLHNNLIEDKGAIVIGNNSFWKKLKILDLSINKIKSEGAVTIGRNSVWTELEELYLYQNMIESEGIETIRENMTWHKLRKLELQGNSTNFKNSLALISQLNERLKDLECVNLSEGKIDRQLLDVLNTSTPELIIDLNFKTKCYHPIHCILIGENKTWTNLKTLDLSDNLIEGLGAQAISANLTWKSLITLNLENCFIGSRGAQYIAQNTTWSLLQTLNLSGNFIRDSGVGRLSKNETWTNLEILNLENNFISALGAQSLSENTSWKNLQELNLAFNRVESQGATHLSKNKTWTKLLKLNLDSNAITAEGVFALCQNKTWINIQSIKLNNNNIGDTALTCVPEVSDPWMNLQVLELRKNPMKTEEILSLLKISSMKKLKVLDLSLTGMIPLNSVKFFKNWDSSNLEVIKLDKFQIGHFLEAKKDGYISKINWYNLNELDLESSISRNDVQHLIRNKSLENLKILNLSMNALGMETVIQELCSCTTLKKLEVLNLQYNGIYPRGAEALGSNETWKNLKILDLGINYLQSQGIAHLTMNATWTNLESLNLCENGIEDVGAAHIARCRYWENLKYLNLSSCRIKDTGASYLGQNKIWKRLETLCLDKNHISAKGAEGLAKNTSWVNLKSLNLANNSLTDQGAMYLSRNTSWVKLEVLNLYKNSIQGLGAEGLKTNTSWRALKYLQLSHNPISAQGIICLSQNQAWRNLEILKLELHTIGREGIKVFSSSKLLMNLKVLKLAACDLRDAGTKELSKNTTWINLRKLNLRSNSIADYGANCLAHNKNWKSLQILKLDYNKITDEGYEYLLKNDSWVNLQQLKLTGNEISTKLIEKNIINPNWVIFKPNSK